MRRNYTGCATLPMACLGSCSCGRGELGLAHQGCSAQTNFIQDCNWWAGTHTGAGTAALATLNRHLEQGDLGYVPGVLPRTCRPTKRLKSTGWYKSGSCNCWWSDAQLVTGFLHDLKEGSECPLSCDVFSERLWLYRVSWGCEKPLLPKAARALWGDENKIQESLRGSWLLQSVAVIVSKPQLHEKVSSEDLAVAGDVPLPAFFCALSC